MRVLDLAALELKRYLSGRMTRLALISVTLIPLLYGALYLWAFWDPYGRLDRVPVALVDEDRAVTAGGTTTHAGQDLATRLLDSKAFAWKVTDARTARDGVQDGTYYLSLTIPADFSAHLASAAGTAPQQAQLQVRTNDANNYLAGQLSRFVFGEIRSAAGQGATRGYLDRIYLGFGTLGTQLDRASDAAGRLASGAHDASSGADRLADGSDGAATGARTLASGARQAAAGAGDLSTGLDRLRSGTAALPGSTRTLATGAAALDQGIGRLAAGTAALPAQAAALDAGAARLAAGAHTLAGGTAALPEQAAQLAAGVDQLAAGVRGAASLADGIGELSRTLQAAAADGDPAAKAVVASADFRALVAGAQRLGDGAGSADQVAAGARRLAAAAPALAAGARSLDAGAGTLVTGTHRLAAAAPALAGGARELDAGAGRLAAGTRDLAAAGPGLAGGVRALSAGADRLATGTSQLASGAGDLAGGLVRLSDGASRLSDGVTRLASGSSTLSTSLAKGAQELPGGDAATTARRTSMMSDPVGLVNERLNAIGDYGTGFAPYFVPLALWIGALLVWFFVRPASARALSSGTAPWRVALGGYLPGAAVGLVQAAAVLLMLHFALGLQAVRPAALWAFAGFSALVFVAVLQAVVKMLGTAGRLVGLVLLMLQLTSCAGTFPIETAPRFFQVINPVLPMTYVTHGLRVAISGGDLATLGHDVLVLACYGVGALALTVWSSRRSTVWTVRALHPELAM